MALMFLFIPGGGDTARVANANAIRAHPAGINEYEMRGPMSACGSPGICIEDEDEDKGGVHINTFLNTSKRIVKSSELHAVLYKRRYHEKKSPKARVPEGGSKTVTKLLALLRDHPSI